MDLLVTQPTLCRSEPPSLYPTRSVRRASGFVLVGDSEKVGPTAPGSQVPGKLALTTCWLENF